MLTLSIVGVIPSANPGNRYVTLYDTTVTMVLCA